MGDESAKKLYIQLWGTVNSLPHNSKVKATHDTFKLPWKAYIPHGNFKIKNK